MSQSLKKTWDDIQPLIPADINHPAINMLVNSGGRTIEIPVFLQQDGEQILQANVTLLPSPNFLQTAALAVLGRKMEQQDISIEWDTASFNAADAPRIPRTAFLMNDPFIHWMEMGVLMNLDMCLQAHANLSEILKKQSLELYEQNAPANLAAIFLGATATVVSTDMEKLVAKNRSVLPFLLNFQPTGNPF